MKPIDFTVINKTRNIAVRVDPTLYKHLTEIATQYNISISEVARTIMEYYFDEVHKD